MISEFIGGMVWLLAAALVAGLIMFAFAGELAGLWVMLGSGAVLAVLWSGQTL